MDIIINYNNTIGEYQLKSDYLIPLYTCVK